MVKDINLRKEIANRIKSYRINANMTQEEVAKLLSIPQQKYIRIEIDAFNLTCSDIIKISKLFNVTSNKILGLND